MNDKQKYSIAARMAVASLITFAGMVAYLCFGKIEPANKDLFNMAIMANIGWVGIAVNYYLGSSDSSAKKSDALNTIAMTPSPLPQSPATGQPATPDAEIETAK